MIIGLVGFKQVGKSTAAEYLEEKYGFYRHNFKDELVAEITKNFPDVLALLREQYNMTTEELFAQKPPLMRALMINYGTEVRRKDDKNYWVKQWHKVADNCGLYKKDLVVDDVRFLNEAQMIKSRGGIIIRLTRPDLTTGGNHQSETEQLIIKADYRLSTPQGNFEELYRGIDGIMAK